MKKLLKWIGIGFLALAVLGGLSSAFVDSVPEEERAEYEQQHQEMMEEFEEKADPIDYGEVYNAYEKNELAAKDEYGGNRYILTATCDGLESGGLMNLTGGATLTVYSNVDGVNVYYLVEFGKKQEEALKSIEVGDEVTFEGTCNGSGHWYDCEIVE